MKKCIDVLIRVDRPLISKNISSRDREKISASNLLKYEKQESVSAALESVEQEAVEPRKITPREYAEEIKKDAQALSDEIQSFIDSSDKALADAYIEYDTNDEKNSMLVTAEEDLFGAATGLITYQMYLKAQEFFSAAKNNLQERSELSGGLNAA